MLYVGQAGGIQVIAYRLISIAPALHGSTKIIFGLGAAGVPGCSEPASFRSEGVRIGEENDKR